MTTAKKATKRKTKPNKPAVAEREGVSASGHRFKIKVELAGLRMNGKKMPAQLAADAIATLLEQSLRTAPNGGDGHAAV